MDQPAGGGSSADDLEDSVPAALGLQLLAGVASPTPSTQVPTVLSPSTSVTGTGTPEKSGNAVSPRAQNKVTIGVKQVSDMLQGKAIKQGGQQTFFITSPASSGNVAGKTIQLQGSGVNEPYLIQTAGGLVTALQTAQAGGQKLILTSRNVQQAPANVGTSVLSTVPATTTVQSVGKPVMVTQHNPGQVKLVTHTSPVQQKKKAQPVKLQLQVQDSTILHKLQQSGQVMTLGGPGDGKQPIRLVLPGTSSAANTKPGQIQLIQTQQGLHKVITLQQPQQQQQQQQTVQQTLQLAQQQKSPVQYAVIPQHSSAGGTGTRLVVVSQPASTSGVVTTVPASAGTKPSVLPQQGAIRIVLPPQSKSGDASKTASTVSSQSIYQILADHKNRKVQIPRASNLGTLQQGQVKIIPSSSIGGTAQTSQGQTCIIVPSSMSGSIGKTITLNSTAQTAGTSTVSSVNKLSPIRQGNTVVHIVSGAGGQQIARVLTTSAGGTVIQKPGVQTVRVVSPSKQAAVSPAGVQMKPGSGTAVKLFTTSGGVGFKQVSATGQNATSKAFSKGALTITTQAQSTLSTSSAAKGTTDQKVISFASVLPKSGSSKETSNVTFVTGVKTPGVASTSAAKATAGNAGAQKMVRILPTKPGQKPTQLVILVNQTAANIGEEVKKIGMELNKLQNQPKTQETVDKLKQLQARLQKLQVAAQLSAKNKTTDTDEPLPTNEKERKKILKQRKLQDKANRIIAEAVAKAKAAGKSDIPKVLMEDEELSAELVNELELEAEAKKKKKKDKKDGSKSKKSSKQYKEKKSKEKKLIVVKKSKPKKLPASAIMKFKRQKRKHGEFSEDSHSSDLDETPPPSPPPDEFNGPGVEKRRSSRNTNRKRYTEEYDFNITSDDSSSDEGKEGGKKKEKKKKKAEVKMPQIPKTIKMKVKTETKPQEEDVDVEGGGSEVDVCSFEPTDQAKFFVDNPDEAEANVVEKILASRLTKKPQIPGEAQVGEIEEFYVKYRNFSYLHCEWATIEKLSADPRIFQKIKRFRLKHAYGFISEYDEGEYFNPDYVIVDRILDKAITKEDDSDEMVTHYLVKWTSLPYEDSTWELDEDVDDAKITIYEKFNKPPSFKERQRKPRPKPSDWKKLSKSPKYKDGNVLREYQLEGVNWLTFSWCNNQSCILADEMGLGKTIQSIGFLREVDKYGIRGPFLVLAPLSTIANWQREVETWTDMNCIVYHGGSQSRHMIAEFELFYKDEEGVRIPDLYKFQILITTYEILLADCQELSEIEWRIVVIDEAHRLKNRNCKLSEGLKILDMEHRVLLTGTPLQNNVDELFSLLNFLEPGRFRSSSQFMEDFGDLKTEGQVEKLQELLRPMMLRRLKEDVEKNLAPKEETIIEVEMTSIQKRYYRAILEKNFAFLNKGANSTTNLPNLMNTMMELRKCCNHPFLINGGEEQIVKEFIVEQALPSDMQISVMVNPLLHLKVLIQSAGKMVLLDKLLPKLKEGGHKVLIFSQMIRCLDILEDYLIQKRYLFERIDGRIRGNMRQAAIDRFSKPDSDRFVFLLCTRAGGLGINLTAADTCIIFDSDWNPQNDIQAQARCHRIGQQKTVKVYRLITRNSYEREMFDKASMKLGLDKAVLQSMRADKDKDDSTPTFNPQQALSKKEIEDLLRRGAYGAIMDDDDESSQFCAEDIDMILQRRTQVIQHKPGMKGSSFAKASFTTNSDHTDITIDDPDFWYKWAKRAEIDTSTGKDDFLMDVPRQRTKTKRFGDMEALDLSSDESEEEQKSKPAPQAKEKKTKEKKEPSQRQPKKQMPCGWTRLECFRVEKGLLTFGWGRWDDILATTRFKRRLGEKDIESIARTMLRYCLQHYKGDENIKSFIWDLVTPAADGSVKDCSNHKGLSAPVPRGRKGKKPKPQPTSINFDLMSMKDQNPDVLLTDQGFKNHLKRHCNKVLLRVRLLYYLKQEVIGKLAEQIENDVSARLMALDIPAPEGDPPVGWWDKPADHSLLIGVFKHGYEKYAAIRLDPCLCFRERCGVPDHREIMAAQAQENEEFNESQLDVEGGDPLDGDEGEGDGLGGEGEDSGGGGEGDSQEKREMQASAIPKHVKDDQDDDSMSPFSTRPSSPSKQTPKPHPVIIPTCVPGKLLFPQAPDLNTRLRRLVAAYQREHKKRQLKEQKREKKEQVKMLRMQEQMRIRELRKIENAQKWSRREEADFYRILTAFGVDKDEETKKFRWDSFRKLAKLDRKYDNNMTNFYEHYYAMCLRICKRTEEIPEGYGDEPLHDFSIEDITEERANKCLARIDLLNKIRTQILPHEHLDERLTKARTSMELPDWWELGRHDKDLIRGVCRYGINRQESQYAMMNDEDLCFKELKEKFPEAAAAMPVPSATQSTPGGASGLPLGPYQRKPGLKKPGPKKGVPRKKKPDAPPGAGPPGDKTDADPPQVDGQDGDKGLDNGPVMGDINHDRTEESNETSSLGQNLDERTRNGKEEDEEVEEEKMEIGQEEESRDAGGDLFDDDVKVKLEDKADSVDMSQDADSINEDIDEGLGSGNDDDDDEDRLDEERKFHPEEEESNMEVPEDSVDRLSRLFGMGDYEDSSSSFAFKAEKDPEDSKIKMEEDNLVKEEPCDMSNDNSNQGNGHDVEDSKPPMSVLQQVLLQGANASQITTPGKQGQNGKVGSKSMKQASSTKKKDSTPKAVVPSFRWPKDRVIVHRLEQLSHLVLKDEWPGRKHHHAPPPIDELYDMDALGSRGPGGLEHNYAGGMATGRKRAPPELNPDGTVKKKKKKKKVLSDAQRAAQFAALMQQNQAMMAAFQASGALPPSLDGGEDAASALSSLAANTPPQATAPLSASSSYHIHDTEFKAVPDFVREGRGPAEGRVVGVLDLSRGKGATKKKKKVKVQTVKIDGKLVKIKKPVTEGSSPKQLKKKKKKHKHKVGSGSGLSTDHHTSTAASESQESQDDGMLGGGAFHAGLEDGERPVKKRKRLKNPVNLDESQITGEEKVGMISKESGKRLAGKHCPSLGNLSDWLVRHPTYNVSAEWGNIVKAKGYLREELKHRVASGKPRHIPIKPALPTKQPIMPSSAKVTIGSVPGSKVTVGSVPGSKVTMQIGQNPLGAISLAGVGKVITTPANAGSRMVAIAPSGPKESSPAPKKKKKKTSSSPGAAASANKSILPRTAIKVDATAASQLAGISPFLLPNTGNVFFSPFLANQGVLQAAGNTVTISKPTVTPAKPGGPPTSVVGPTIKVLGAANVMPRKRTHAEISATATNSSMKDDDSSDSDDSSYGQLKMADDI